MEHNVCTLRKVQGLAYENVLWSSKATCTVHQKTNCMTDLEATAQLLAHVDLEAAKKEEASHLRKSGDDDRTRQVKQPSSVDHTSSFQTAPNYIFSRYHAEGITSERKM